MNRAESKANQVDAAVLELAEAVELQGRVGETFGGIGAKIVELRAKITVIVDDLLILINRRNQPPEEKDPQNEQRGNSRQVGTITLDYCEIHTVSSTPAR